MVEIVEASYRYFEDRLPPAGLAPRLECGALPDFAAAERLNAATLLIDRIRRSPWRARMAIRTLRTSWSYGRLLDAVDRLAHVLLADLAVRPGDRVLLRAGNGPMLVAAWLAAARIGAVVVPTHPHLRRRELSAVLLRAGITHALCQEDLAAELRQAIDDLALPVPLRLHGDGLDEAELEAAMARFGPTEAAASTPAEAPCLIALSAGGGGQPKAALHSHRAVAAATRCWAEDILRPTGADLVCGSLPLSQGQGLLTLMLAPLGAGVATVLLPDLAAEALAEAIGHFRPTVCAAPPSHYRRLMRDRRPADLAGLDRCLATGEPLSAELARNWRDCAGAPLFDALGCAETLAPVLAARPEEVPPGLVGRALLGYRLRVLDEAGGEIADGAPGRLAALGPTGCCYLGDVAAQRAALAEGWTLTGDIVAREGNGFLRHIARLDDLIVTAGQTVAGPEIEAVLAEHPAVRRVAVVGLPDPVLGEQVAAFVVPTAGATASPALAGRLQEHVRYRLAPYKTPASVHFLEEMPTTATDAIDRRALRLLVAEPAD